MCVLAIMNVIILCGGPSSEYEVSLSTTEVIINNIDPCHKVQVLLMDQVFKSVLFTPQGDRNTFPEAKDDLATNLNKIPKDSIVLIAMHGEFGEDGVVQSLLDSYNLKYTGSDARSSVLGMNKYAAISAIKDKVDVKFPKIFTIGKLLSVNPENYTFPVILKPINLGSSVGVEIAKTLSGFKKSIVRLEKKFSGIDFLIQGYIEAAVEVSCGCLKTTNDKYIELPPVEICPQSNVFYDYKSKYAKGGSNHFVPPVSIDKTLQDKISKIACDIHKIIGCGSYSRSDFLIKDREIFFLEINTLPGMTSTSLIPEEAKAIGMNYRELLNFLIENV